VAQFMPATANWRGLSNPFDPLEAKAESAKLLRDLRREFGNLGLAAAAYNAGSGRVRDWPRWQARAAGDVEGLLRSAAM
jgi:soluble lytic murein transglycosylase-like protein